MTTPWDIYIDERKVAGDKALGFLLVPNTASFMHKLHLCRNIRGEFRPHEVHWSNLRGDSREIAENWIYRVFQHAGVKFYAVRWEPGRTKDAEIIRFVDRVVRNKRLKPPYNIVVFLDFDSEHSREDSQNAIRHAANIARCYHLDSRNNDCIQCCDLLLNALVRIRDDHAVRQRFPVLQNRIVAGDRLSVSDTKVYLAGVLAKHIDQHASCVYDLTNKAASEGAESSSPQEEPPISPTDSAP